MKVFEKLNQLKSTNASKEQIATWAYMNRVCPIMFGEELELECKYPKEMSDIANATCKKHISHCGTECLASFLDSEI